MAIVLSVGLVNAQDKKMEMKPMPKAEMDMAEMHKSPHQKMMMAHVQTALAFTRSLWDMSSDGKIEDIALARAAFSEIKRSMEKADEIHKMHMASIGKMDAAMMEKMKPMMEKMAAENAVIMMHLSMLDKALQATSPDAQEIAMHTAFLILKFEKMSMPEMKMEMPGKMAM
ncbi:hypothetical protein BH10ACI2_BH10ACI2_21870 [soil metagenome]